jgi:16S rRNA G966 N2-methylase RsmD
LASINELISLIQREDIREFISANRNEDIKKLVLKYKGRLDFDIAAIAEQISLRKKAESKIPSFLTPSTVLLPKLFEQSTHEEVAKLKTQFIRGESLLDLTAGLGIDAWWIGKTFTRVVCIESSADHTHVLGHNYEALGFKAEVHNSSAEDFLERDSSNYDIIYLDPDRRPSEKREQFEISKSEPDIIKLLPLVLKKAKEAWIKLSPMVSVFDIREAFGRNLHQVIAIAYRNELKEILVCVEESFAEKIKFIAANTGLESNGGETEIFISENPGTACPISLLPKKYFFEPNVALIKSRLAFEYAIENKLELLYPDGSYFTGDDFGNNLHGRSFEIIESMPYKPRLMNDFIQKNSITQVNIACRNFHWKPEEVKKSLKLKDGGELYLFCYNDFEQKSLAVWCRKKTETN